MEVLPMHLCGKRIYKFAKRYLKSFLSYKVSERAIYSKDDHLKLLLTASLVNGFIEGTSISLNNVPTGETVLSHIKTQDPHTLVESFRKHVEMFVNKMREKKHLCSSVPIAIDWHDVMYYGNPATPMVIGTQHKNGSNYAFEYLTASITIDGERLILDVIPLITRKDVYSAIKQVLTRIQELKIKIRYVTLDGGFFSTETIQYFEKTKIKYILRMPQNNKTKKIKLKHGTTITYKTNNHKKRKYEQIQFNATTAYDPIKKYFYLFATNIKQNATTILKMFSKRWGIETTYRITNQFLIKTTSLQYTVRLFYYLFACMMYNIWIQLNELIPLITTQLKIILLTTIQNNKKLTQPP